jgi:hypothetical protein
MSARLGVFAIGLTLLLASGFAARSWAAGPDGKEAAIRKVIEAQVEAWNRGDAKAHAADCREGILFTNILGATYDTCSARMLQVLVEDGGRWRVAAYHNVDVKALPEPR